MIHPGADLHPSDDWYTNGKTRYPGTTDHHFLFPALYHHADDSSNIRAFSSVDTVSWTRIPGGSILPADDPRSWDAGFVTASIDLVPLPGGKVGLPYGGARYPHKYPRNRHTWDAMKKAYALWTKERITALIADEAGRFTTLPLLFDGHRLRLNYRTTQGERAASRRPRAAGQAATARRCRGAALPTAFRWPATRPTASSPGRPAKTWATPTDSLSRCASG